MKFGETPEEYAQRMQAAPKPLGIMRLRIAELEREVADWKRTCFELVTDGNDVTLAQSLQRMAAENAQLRACLGSALRDTDLLDAWEKSGGFLIGKTDDERWQAACQTPGLIGQALVDSNLRGLLMQVEHASKS